MTCSSFMLQRLWAFDPDKSVNPPFATALPNLDRAYTLCFTLGQMRMFKIIQHLDSTYDLYTYESSAKSSSLLLLPPQHVQTSSNWRKPKFYLHHLLQEAIISDSHHAFAHHLRHPSHRRGIRLELTLLSHKRRLVRLRPIELEPHPALTPHERSSLSPISPPSSLDAIPIPTFYPPAFTDPLDLLPLISHLRKLSYR